MSLTAASTLFSEIPAVTVPVWGIDPSTRRVSVGVLAPALDESAAVPHWRTLSLGQGATAARLARAFADLRPFVREIVERFGVPTAVFVEQPFAGKIEHVHPESYYMLGVVLASLATEVPDAHIELVSPAEWKCRALGKGRGFAKKPEVYEWAQSLGYSGSLQDEADALGVAVGGAILARIA